MEGLWHEPEFSRDSKNFFLQCIATSLTQWTQRLQWLPVVKPRGSHTGATDLDGNRSRGTTGTSSAALLRWLLRGHQPQTADRGCTKKKHIKNATETVINEQNSTPSILYTPVKKTPTNQNNLPGTGARLQHFKAHTETCRSITKLSECSGQQCHSIFWNKMGMSSQLCVFCACWRKMALKICQGPVRLRATCPTMEQKIVKSTEVLTWYRLLPK